MYVIELILKLSPFPLSIQRKELENANKIYKEICDSISRNQSNLFELTCEQVEGKRLSVIPNEILAVQIYEKTASAGGTKRPGFSFED